MLFFADKLTIPLIRQTGKKSVLEIGSSYGNSVRPLMELGDIEVAVIDPCLDADLAAVFGDRITLHKGLSLEILPTLEEPYDCIFIDGDHNWYTVFNELKVIEKRKLLKAGGFIFLHDIGWPYGRRDMYYQPDCIPAAYVKPYAKRGIQRGRSLPLTDGGFNSGHHNAVEEFGPRNGVLTAVEDYLRQSRQEYYFIKDFREFGFGILMRQSKENNWRRALSLQLEVFRQRRIDPTLGQLSTSILGLRKSALANGARRIRDKYFRTLR